MKHPGSTLSAVAAFEKAFQSFDAAKVERSKAWPAVFASFKTAFATSRKDRAAYTPRLNILDVFGLNAWELCHSRAVAWFLNENETHEQGGLFMNCLLKECGVSDAAYTGYIVQRERPERVDVVAYKPGAFAVFIENKVEHHERPNQFEDLQKALVKFSGSQIRESHRFAVFLTDHGGDPKTKHNGPLEGFRDKNLRPISRLRLFQAFRNALAACPNKSDLLTIFLDHYVEAIKSNHESDYAD